MSEDRIFPPLVIDGQIEVLTGLDAPEIFYKFLEQAIARSHRQKGGLIALIRFRFIADQTRFGAQGKRSLEFEVVALGDFLKKRTRADERVVRIGEATFLILALVDDQSGLDEMINRFSSSLADFYRNIGGQTFLVENNGIPPQGLFEVELSSFTYQEGETLLDLLERAGV